MHFTGVSISGLCNDTLNCNRLPHATVCIAPLVAVQSFPIKTTKWAEYLQTSRDNVSMEVESGAALDEESTRIKQFVREKRLEYKQQFDEAII